MATLPCVEGWSVTLLWQGVPINDLLSRANVSPDATALIFLASDGYSTSLPLDYVKQNNITIAYKINNVTLTPRTGWPFFLVAKNQYGYKWIEWLTEINVSDDSNYLGYWESRGYPNDATVRDPNLQPIINVPTLLPAILTSIGCLAIAVAVFFSRRKVKKKQKLTLLENTETKIDLSSKNSEFRSFFYIYLKKIIIAKYTINFCLASLKVLACMIHRGNPTKIIEDGKRFLSENLTLLPILSKDGANVAGWSSETLRYLGDNYIPKDRPIQFVVAVNRGTGERIF